MPEIKTNYNIRPYFDYLYEKSGKRRIFGYNDDMPAARITDWQKDLAVEFSQALGLPYLLEDKGTLEAVREDYIKREGYGIEKLRVNIAPMLDVPVYILKPDGAQGRLPAVFCFYGHGRGACDVLDLPDPCGFNGDPSYQKYFPLSLVKRGFLVVVIEIMGFGELFMHNPWSGGSGKCDAPSVRGLMFGASMGGLRVFEAIRAVDYALTRADIDEKRMGSIGISGGGLLASFHAALDSRMAASVVSGYFCTFKDSIYDIAHCIDNYVPNILNICEMPDIFSLIAPRALLVSNGSEDDIFPIKAAKKGYEQLCDVYAKLGAADKLEHDFYEGGHMISGGALYDFLEKRLMR